MRYRHIGLVVALSGCGPAIALEADDGGNAATSGDAPAPASEGASASGGAVPPPSTSTTADGIEDSSTGESSDFIVAIDLPDYGNCSLMEQDCAEGFKCMPFSLGGSIWDSAGCFPVDPDPVGLGEPCEHELDENGGWSGLDNCGWAAVCWDFDPDGPGHCEGLCIDDGVADWAPCEDPAAVPSAPCQSCFCTCEVPCDPLASDCPGDTMCVITTDLASCIPDASGDAGAAGDACEFVNGCDPGLACVAGEFVPGCEELASCCTPYCRVSDPVCPEGSVCEPYYPDGNGPPHLDDVGLCLL